MAENILIVFCTFGSVDEARRVAKTVIEERLVACATLLPQVESIYRWKGAVETAQETQVIFKTHLDRYYLLEARIKKLHSYEVPEILAFKAHAGLFSYLQWVDESSR
jgi:periplasmic divalent cation tolerance protein